LRRCYPFGLYEECRPAGEPVVLSAALVTERAARGGPAARWLQSVPVIVQQAVDQWHLNVDDGELMHGGFAVVVPVHRGNEACVLKVSPLAEAVAAALLRRLAGVPAPAGVPSLRQIAETIADSLQDRNERAGGPVPKPYLDAAAGLARELVGVAGDRLVHADLHYGNVLAGDREPWLAIDPRAVAGDPEHAVPELLWTRLDEVGGAGLRRLLAVLVTEGDLDPELARSWSIVRCVDYWLWALENGLTQDPERCQRIIEILIGEPA
jgi:streptomycin 6-kinase